MIALRKSEGSREHTMPGGVMTSEMSTYEFDAVIEEARRGGAWVTIPFSVPKVFGTKGQVKVKDDRD